MLLYLIASMCGDGGLLNPLEERLLLLLGEARRMIERRVISGRHRTSANRLFDSLQRCRSLLRIVTLPVGKIEHAPRGVSREVGRRNRRIPRRGSSGRMAFIASALEDRAHLRVSADRIRRRRNSRSRSGCRLRAGTTRYQQSETSQRGYRQ